MKTRQIIITIILGFSIILTAYNPAFSRSLHKDPLTTQDEFVITAVYPNFDSTNIQAFQLNGHATLAGDRLQLTEPIVLQTGTAWWQRRITLLDERSFSAYFTFEISQPGNGGADGMVFAIQTQSSGAGTVGGGMGYGGIPNSVGIEFDTYFNDTVDPDGNHLGLNLNGSMTSLKTANPPGNLESGIWHVWVDYDGLSDLLEVRMDDTISRPVSAVLTDTIDLAAAFDPDVFVGFTAATGGSYERHEVLSFYFHNDYLPGGIIPGTHTYHQAPAQVTIAATPQIIPADGTTTSTISATALDVLGTPLAGFSITFDTDLGAINPLTAISGPDGVATAHLSSSTIGTANVRATAIGGAYAEVNVVIDPPVIKLFLPLLIK